MTHISLSVSRRGGVPHDALAWKILFEGTCGGLTEQPIFWGKRADTVTLPNLFLSQVWDVEQWNSTASLHLEASPPPLLAIQFVQLSANMSQSILKSVPSL